MSKHRRKSRQITYGHVLRHLKEADQRAFFSELANKLIPEKAHLYGLRNDHIIWCNFVEAKGSGQILFLFARGNNYPVPHAATNLRIVTVNNEVKIADYSALEHPDADFLTIKLRQLLKKACNKKWLSPKNII